MNEAVRYLHSLKSIEPVPTFITDDLGKIERKNVEISRSISITIQLPSILCEDDQLASVVKKDGLAHRKQGVMLVVF